MGGWWGEGGGELIRRAIPKWQLLSTMTAYICALLSVEAKRVLRMKRGMLFEVSTTSAPLQANQHTFE